MIRASRALHDDFANFKKVYDHHVTVSAPDEAVRQIWEQERDTHGFAVNGELTNGHWSDQMASFYELNPDLPRITRADVMAEPFVAWALDSLGLHDGVDQPD
jgi:hypothetical protein